MLGETEADIVVPVVGIVVVPVRAAEVVLVVVPGRTTADFTSLPLEN